MFKVGDLIRTKPEYDHKYTYTRSTVVCEVLDIAYPEIFVRVVDGCGPWRVYPYDFMLEKAFKPTKGLALLVYLQEHLEEMSNA